MRFILSLLLILQPILSTAQTTNKAAEFNIADGVSYSKNFVINPSARKNINNLGIAAGTATRETGAGYQFDGISSIKYDSGAINGTLTFSLSTITSPALSGNCEFYFYYKGDGTTWRAYIGDGVSEISSVVLQNATDWRFVNLFAPCGATPEVGITETSTTNKTLYFAGAYYGQAVHLGSGVPPNTFTALVSSTGAVSRETGGDWINGNCTQSSGSFDCTFATGLFTSPPNCTGALNPGVSADQALNRIDAGTTSVNVRTQTGAGTGTSVGFQISCTKTGSDYIQPAITPNQWNFDWTTCPTITGGWTGAVSYACKWMRKGGDAYFDMVISTSGAPTGSTLTVNLPITIDTSKLANITNSQKLPESTATLDDSGTTFYDADAFYSSTTQFTLRSKTSSPVVLSGNTVTSTAPFSFNSGDAVKVSFRVPVVGWTENQGAPQLVNSVITQYNGVNSKIESELNCDASSSITSQSGGISTIGNRSGNTCALTLTSGVFTATPWKCQVTVKSTTVQATGCTCSSATSCTIAGPSADFDAYVSIEGPK